MPAGYGDRDIRIDTDRADTHGHHDDHHDLVDVVQQRRSDDHAQGHSRERRRAGPPEWPAVRSDVVDHRAIHCGGPPDVIRSRAVGQRQNDHDRDGHRAARICDLGRINRIQDGGFGGVKQRRQDRHVHRRAGAADRRHSLGCFQSRDQQRERFRAPEVRAGQALTITKLHRNLGSEPLDPPVPW